MQCQLIRLGQGTGLVFVTGDVGEEVAAELALERLCRRD